MIPQFYRIAVINNSGQTVAFDTNGRITVKITGSSITPATGKTAYTDITPAALIAGGESVANGVEVRTVEIDNTTNLFTDIQIQLEVTHDAGLAADGTFDMFVIGGDATGELPSDASGYVNASDNGLSQLGSLTWEPNAADDDVQLSDVFQQ